MDNWKDIEGYEGLYAVSDTGKVRSKEKWVVNSQHNTKRLIKGRVLKPWLNPNGYYTFNFSKSSKRKTVYAHRLVADAFVNNRDNKNVVNHIDGDKLNNHIDNLEWVTYSENLQHSWNTGLQNNQYTNN